MYQYADETKAKLIYITILAIHVHLDNMGLDVRKPVWGEGGGGGGGCEQKRCRPVQSDQHLYYLLIGMNHIKTCY